MGTRKGRKLLAIEHMKMEFRVIPKKYADDLGDRPGAFTPRTARKYLPPMSHINLSIEKPTEDEKKKSKKKEKNLKAEPYIKDE